MELKEIMDQKVFAVVGNTLDEEKYACRIKKAMLEHGYTVYAVGKELASINDVPEEIDIIDLCIHPVKGLALMRECRKSFKCIVIQPGAESPELLQYLDDQKLPYIQGCLLVGLSRFKRCL
jgi:predicted CoA-binding protein